MKDQIQKARKGKKVEEDKSTSLNGGNLRRLKHQKIRKKVTRRLRENSQLLTKTLGQPDSLWRLEAGVEIGYGYNLYLRNNEKYKSVSVCLHEDLGWSVILWEDSPMPEAASFKKEPSLNQALLKLSSWISK